MSVFFARLICDLLVTAASAKIDWLLHYSSSGLLTEGCAWGR